MIGTTLGRYRILEPLGEGGMGRVYLAEDPALGRKVAVKVLPPEFSRDPERRQRLLHEARAASALNHPNILTVYDLGESDGALYVAMERIEGCTLREWARGQSHAPLEVLRLARQALAALGAAHTAGLVHRDLKPENIMVRGDGLLKILDFGLARSVSPGTVARTETLPGTILGTAPYMSPEQVLGQPAGPASDLFSFGTILYELLTGRHPFAAGTAVETMHRILHESPESPSRVNRALTADFDFVLAKALSKDATRRHGSAHDLDVDVETLECGCGIAAPVTGGGDTGPRAIAVLPFRNIGGDPELGYLGVGLADAVITRLSSSPDLVVRATSSVAAYQNQAVDPRRVGAELDVSAVLDASFQKIGERFRATARLVETASGRSLWAGKVDLRFDDIFEVQDQVAQGIADGMTARLEKGGAAGSAYAPSAAAYELMLRGSEAFRAADIGGVRRAIDLFEQAVRLEPRYADAWAHLGWACFAMLDGGFDFDPEWKTRALEALARALTLDPENTQARFGMAAVRLTQGAKSDAYAALVDVRRRAPNHSLMHHYFSYLFRLCDMLDEGLAASTVALEIDPASPWPWRTAIQIRALQGNLRGAREELEAFAVQFGQRARTESSEVALLAFEGRYQEMSDLVAGGAVLAGSAMFDIALAWIKLGNRANAAASIDRCERFATFDMDAAAHAAALRAHLGESDAAFVHLERAAALGNDCLHFYENPIFFEPLFIDPRWQPFLDGVRGRVARWKREFKWPPD
ncbi:MAG: protein kinase domain-containing protein [Bacteroidota bacterium]